MPDRKGLETFFADAKKLEKKVFNKVTSAFYVYAGSATLALEGFREYASGKNTGLSMYFGGQNAGLAVYLGIAALGAYMATNLLKKENFKIDFKNIKIDFKPYFKKSGA